MLPSNSSSITTQLISDERAASVLSSDWAICDHRTALDYFRLSADNRLLFSGLSNDTGLEPRDLINTVRKKMDKGYPQLQRINIDDGWSGQMGNGLNRMAQLDRRANTVFYIQAYSGHGVTPAHSMGRITAMISGTTEHFDITPQNRSLALSRRETPTLLWAHYRHTLF